jgi:hypothetical protein
VLTILSIGRLGRACENAKSMGNIRTCQVSWSANKAKGLVYFIMEIVAEVSGSSGSLGAKSIKCRAGKVLNSSILLVLLL